MAASAPPPTAPVRIADAVAKTIPLEVRAVGSVEPYSTITVKAQVGGVLIKVNFKDGDFVHKGDLLFEIDPRPFEQAVRLWSANLQRDRANLAQAEANLAHDRAQQKYAVEQAKRFERLQKEGVFSRDQAEMSRSDADAKSEALRADLAAIDAARGAIAADDAAAEKARVDLGYCQIRSPIDGRAGTILVKQGNLVKATDVELVTIHQIQPIYVSFAIPEKFLTEIRTRMKDNKLLVTAFPQDSPGGVQGALTFIDNAVDNATGTIKLKGTFTNADTRLWPGQFLDVALRMSERPGTVVIPSAAIQTGQMGNYVFIVKPDLSVDLRPVKVGPKVGADIAIETGLQPGDRVVIEGQVRLAPGMKVKVLS